MSTFIPARRACVLVKGREGALPHSGVRVTWGYMRSRVDHPQACVGLLSGWAGYSHRAIGLVARSFLSRLERVSSLG